MDHSACFDSGSYSLSAEPDGISRCLLWANYRIFDWQTDVPSTNNGTDSEIYN